MSTLDAQYSKWDNIEISDDESDCHPNIDKESWFRLKHRTRVEREESEAEEHGNLENENSTDLKRILELKEKLKVIRATQQGVEIEGENEDAINAEISSLEKKMAQRTTRIEFLDKHKKWNWENMCHVVEERTLVNEGDENDEMTSQLPPKLREVLEKPTTSSSATKQMRNGAIKKISGERPPSSTTTISKSSSNSSTLGPVTPERTMENYSSFVEEHADMMERYSEMTDIEQIRDFLRGEGSVLFADHAQSYLLLSCLEDEMNGKRERMKNTARQSQYLTNITELAVSLRRLPQDVVSPFFSKLQEASQHAALEQAVAVFVERVVGRAVEKRKEMDAEREKEGENYVELSKEERMGPGGLDPIEVLDSLPEEMQEAFTNRDTEALKVALSNMPNEEAQAHIKRCVDSGLWVPGGNSKDEEDE